MADRWVVLVEIAFDTATTYHSYAGESTPSQHYDDRLRSVSRIIREVDVIEQVGRIADCTIRLANEDGYFSRLRHTDSWRNRTVTVKFGNATGGFSSLITVFTGQISAWRMVGYDVELNVRDASYEKFRIKLDGHFTTTDFVDLPVTAEPELVPIIFGDCNYTTTSRGVIPCQSIDPAITDAKYVYLVARHEIDTTGMAVYIGDTLKATPGDYTVHTAQTYGSFTDCTTVKFTAEPADVVTVRCYGYYKAATYAQTPAEWIEALLTQFAGVAAADLDTTAFAATNPYTGGYLIDDRDMTVQDILDEICGSFNIVQYRTRSGDYAIYQALPNLYAYTYSYLIGFPPGLVQATLTSDDIKDLQIEYQESVVSRLQGDYQYNYSGDYFERQTKTNDEIAEDELGQEVRVTMNQWAARETAVSAADPELARLCRKYLMRESFHYASFTLPPEHYTLELCYMVGLTHPLGVGEAGYDGEAGLIVGLEIDPAPTNPSIRARCFIMGHARPTDFPELSLWLDATKITGKTDGEALAAWSDMSGNGLDATGATNPTYRSADYGIGGLPAVEFDGNDYMTIGDNALLTLEDASHDAEFTMFAVVKDTADNSAICGKGDGANAANREYEWYENQLYLQGGVRAADSNPGASPRVLTCTAQTDSLKVYRDGTWLATVDMAGSSYATDLTYDFYLGRAGSGSASYFTGLLGELVIFRGKLSYAQRAAVENYLGAKWGILVGSEDL